MPTESIVFVILICHYKNLIKLIDNEDDDLHDCMKYNLLFSFSRKVP
jgi:hypothetical protein